MTLSANKLRLDTLNKILKNDSTQKAKRTHDLVNKQVSKVAISELLADSTNAAVPDFKTFLSLPANVEEFRNFLKTQYSQENIDFYLACEKYKNLDINKVGKDLIIFMATQIYNDYLGENAKQRVNINDECSQRIKRQRRQPTPDMFNEAQLEIFNLMRSDCYPRFCKTWRVDRKTAKRILTEKFVNSAAKSINLSDTSVRNDDSYLHCNTTRSSFDIDLTNSLVSTQSQPVSSLASSAVRGVKRKLECSVDRCPPGCPYYKVGLPCRQHSPDASGVEERGSSDLIDRVDLGRMHRVPRSCIRRSPPLPPLPMRRPIRPPPPPPLPPKFEDENEEDKTHLHNHGVYVSEVYHV